MTPQEEAAFVREHRGYVIGHARRASRTGGGDIEDCVQDAYLALVLACRRHDPQKGAALRTYVTTAMLNQASSAWVSRNRLKRKRVETSLDAEIPGMGTDAAPLTLHDLIGTPATQESDIDRGRAIDAVRRAMRRLPPRSVMILRRHFFEGETFAEIGASLGMSGEGVRQVHLRALAQMRERLLVEVSQ